MNNFAFGGGGMKRRSEYIGGRPLSDANYGPKKKKNFGSKPNFRSHDRSDRDGDKQLFTTNCTTCGKSCEVPFRPDGSKPVLCRDCFAKNHPTDRRDSPRSNKFDRNDRGSDRGSFRKPERSHTSAQTSTADATHYNALAKQVTELTAKLDEVLSLLQSMQPTATASATISTGTATPEEASSEKTLTTKKKTATKKPAVKKATKKTATKAKKATK